MREEPDAAHTAHLAYAACHSSARRSCTPSAQHEALEEDACTEGLPLATVKLGLDNQMAPKKRVRTYMEQHVASKDERQQYLKESLRLAVADTDYQQTELANAGLLTVELAPEDSVSERGTNSRVGRCRSGKTPEPPWRRAHPKPGTQRLTRAGHIRQARTIVEWPDPPGRP